MADESKPKTKKGTGNRTSVAAKAGHRKLPGSAGKHRTTPEQREEGRYQAKINKHMREL